MERMRAERGTWYIDRLKRTRETIKIVLTLNFMSVIKGRGEGSERGEVKISMMTGEVARVTEVPS